ncbi:3-deoxy-7-phosphoheptulonate synthase [Marinitenerispora sediminis]|uniref:Phospho-2-dehydro-3-deoxyheptonate aldolase n=1 Tax=Marinitenerispora sediminis TaxID=1931232 RepID=A0A368SZJ6_9ACTN|nr:3-deoxy-7-phosphoheptulonate synthase [Marinitenerispora sediminis]RCV51495.1 3-deoxy-7-phosphoheptulonate synthase [Marinitenerispora sediminis]RCV52290.1 3-deoxy-7-phosphoheptulonate synthase [Marinitenerispora sediminis]RCV58830.1 3-deoxy-7-phosphoheptulonate synthase [Marinitenerispora sediminis]
MSSTNDTRVVSYQPLVAPQDVLAELPTGPERAALVEDARAEVKRVLDGDDDRLLVIVGPCSVHDPVAALEYAERLKAFIPSVNDELCVVMRVYFEKPRTTLGWKGLINDPGLDESYDVHRGLRTARKLLLDIGSLGVPAGTEFLDPITPQYIADAVAWGAIGARTTESQVHRQLGSGLSMPVGFKNGTDGDVQVAVDACGASAAPHTFFGVDPAGAGAVVTTSGNPDCHVILRGGRSGPNYDADSVQNALDVVEGAGLPRRLMIDASHANSGKDHRRQPVVAEAIAAQVAEGQRGIIGVMLESFLLEGAQRLGDPAALAYGQSITDACMGWETTEGVLTGLAEAVRQRRKAAR